MCVKHVISRETGKIAEKFSKSYDLRPGGKLKHRPSYSSQAYGTDRRLYFVVCAYGMTIGRLFDRGLFPLGLCLLFAKCVTLLRFELKSFFNCSKLLQFKILINEFSKYTSLSFKSRGFVLPIITTFRCHCFKYRNKK